MQVTLQKGSQSSRKLPRSVWCQGGKVYVVDHGLGRVVVFYREEDGQETAEVLGQQGSREGQFQVGKFSGEEY